MATISMISQSPDPRLRPYVADYCLYEEDTGTPMARRELPSHRVTLIVNTGAPIRVGEHGGDGWTEQPVGFVAGLWDTFAVTETPGSQRGLQVDLTPVGAHLLLRLPMSELTNRVVPLDQLLGAAGARLREEVAAGGSERLGAAGARLPDQAETAAFEAIDRFLLDRLDDALSPVPTVTRALARLYETAGAIRVGQLADEIGCSRRHLVARFNEQVGVPPKLLARILRFERATALAEELGDWGEIAQECGYYDQAHLIRDFNQFAGCPPGELARRCLPDGGGVAA